MIREKVFTCILTSMCNLSQPHETQPAPTQHGRYQSSIFNIHTILQGGAPTSCTWAYNPYKSAYKGLTGVITSFSAVISPHLAPPCTQLLASCFSSLSCRVKCFWISWEVDSRGFPSESPRKKKNCRIYTFHEIRVVSQGSL